MRNSLETLLPLGFLVCLVNSAYSQDLKGDWSVEKAETLLAEFVDLDLELPEKYGYVLRLNLLTDPGGKQFVEKRIVDNYVRDSAAKVISLTRTIEVVDPLDGRVLQGEMMQFFKRGSESWFRRNSGEARLPDYELWGKATQKQQNEVLRFEPLSLPTFVLWRLVGDPPDEGFLLNTFLEYKPLGVGIRKGKLISHWILKEANPNLGHLQTLAFEKDLPVEYTWTMYQGKWNPDEISSLKSLPKKGSLQAKISTRWDTKQKLPLEIDGVVSSLSKLSQRVDASIEWRKDIPEREFATPPSLVRQQKSVEAPGVGQE
ncbi:MAG: hypothetical protein AAF483_30585 [Planctomycetota bacterium]